MARRRSILGDSTGNHIAFEIINTDTQTGVMLVVEGLPEGFLFQLASGSFFFAASSATYYNGDKNLKGYQLFKAVAGNWLLLTGRPVRDELVLHAEEYENELKGE